MYSDKITQNVALAVMKVMDEELSAKQKKIAVVAGDPKKIDAEDFKKLRKEDAEPLDELSVKTLSSYGTKAAKTTKKIYKDSNDHYAKGYDLHYKNLAKGNGPYSKDAEKSIAHIDKSDALLQKHKNRNSSIDLAAKKLGNKFSKGVSEDVVAEAKHEPAKPDAAAVLRRKKIQDIEDRKEKAKAAPSNVRKHEGSAYGGGKQKYDMDESMDRAKSLAQKGMKSEPGSMTSITRDKAGKVTSYQVTGPMKKTDASDPMARARALAQKGMKLPEEVEQIDEEIVGPSPREYHAKHTEYPLRNDLNKFNLKYLHDAHAHHSYTRDLGALVTGQTPRGVIGGGPRGAAADAVKRIDRHVREKYGSKAAKQLSHANAPIEGPDGGANFKKTLAHAKEHMEKKKETTSEETTFSGLLASIHENGLTAIHEMFVRESASEEEFNAELKVAQEKSEGKGKKAEIAKGQVVAVKNEEVEQIDEISTKTLARAARAASDPDSDYGYGQEKSHDPQKFADYAKKTKDAKSASAVQGAADAKGHYPRPGHTYGYDKLADRTPSRVTGAGKANKQDTNALKNRMKEETEVVEYELDVNETNGVRMHTFKERYGNRK